MPFYGVYAIWKTAFFIRRVVRMSKLSDIEARLTDPWPHTQPRKDCRYLLGLVKEIRDGVIAHLETQCEFSDELRALLDRLDEE